MKEQLLVTVPNKILTEVTKPVTSFDDDLKNQIDLMTKILRDSNGVGLASNQIGFNNQVFVVELKTEDGKEDIPLQVFVNPQIVSKSDELKEMTEGCLSVPKIELLVTRPEKVKIKAQDENGKKIKLTAKGLLARIVQHETDHLHGKIFTELAKDQLMQKNPELKKSRIVFVGTGAFSEMILRGMILLGFNITTVITEKGKPSGRKKEICPSIVAQTAHIFNRKLIETDNIKNLTDDIKKENPDFIILSDFGQIVPKEILDIPKIMAVNLHPSLLPKYRGATPIQSAILAGDKETGVSIIKMSPELDKGDILAKSSIEITEDDNALSMRDQLSNLALQMLIKLLPKLINNEIKPTSQNDDLATYTKKLKKEDGQINWDKSAIEIDRQIRGLFGWPGAYTEIDGKRLIFHQAHIDDDKLVLDIVQPEGKNIMFWQDFLRGFKGQEPNWFKKIR